MVFVFPKGRVGFLREAWSLGGKARARQDKNLIAEEGVGVLELSIPRGSGSAEGHTPFVRMNVKP